MSRPARAINERFGGQVGQMLGAAEQRSERIPLMRERVAQAATTQMARMDAEDPLHRPARDC
ncbi:MAG TPA: hypothetical protein VGA76_11230 [Candidatus Dormibacteraeota bacterium]